MGLAEALYYAEAVSARRRSLAKQASETPSREGVTVEESSGWLSDEELLEDATNGNGEEAPALSDDLEALLSKLDRPPAKDADNDPDE